MVQAGFPPTSGSTTTGSKTSGSIGVPVTDEEKRDNAGNALNDALQDAQGVGNRSEMDSNSEGVGGDDPIPTPSDPILSPEGEVKER